MGPGPTQRSEAVNGELARIAGALANPTRLRAINLLLQEPKAIEELASALGESQANTTAHMKVLRGAGLVVADRRGKFIFQQVNGEEVLRLFMALRVAGEALSAPIRLLNDAADDSESVLATDELNGALCEEDTVLVDLRPAREFAAGHLPGARSVPVAHLGEHAAALRRHRRVLAYCRGRYCTNAVLGVDILRADGVSAERLAFGVPEWRAAGQPIVIGAVNDSSS